MFVIGSDLPDTTHTVTIKLLPDAPDKARILAQRNQRMDDPQKFAGLTFNPGAILLLGELIP